MSFIRFNLQIEAVCIECFKHAKSSGFDDAQKRQQFLIKFMEAWDSREDSIKEYLIKSKFSITKKNINVIYGKVRKKVSKTLENSLMQYGDVFSNTHFSLFTRSIGMSIYKLLP